MKQILKLIHFKSIAHPFKASFCVCLIAILFISSNAFAQYAAPPVPIPITANWTLEVNQAYAAYGSSVASAGDVNGDGYADIIVGAPLYDNGQTDEGAAFVYYGSATGLNATPVWMMQSNQVGAQFGYSVASAGDVNHDGYSDVIIGAPFYDDGQTNEGKAFVYLGGPAGLSGTPAWTAESDIVGGMFGYSVASAGDVNGDGFDEVVVGGPKCYTNYADYGAAGKAYVFYGSAAGLSPTVSWYFDAIYDESWVGNSVACAGDVNGDGYDDVIVGAEYMGWDGPGKAYVFYGSATGLHYLSWATPDEGESEYLGTAVSSAGDVNGDGFDDVAVSGPGPMGPYDTYLYYGSATGLSGVSWAIKSNIDWSVGGSLSFGDFNSDGFSDILIEGNELVNVFTGGPSGIPGTTSWIATSDEGDALFGASVSSAGDINGDGYDDIIAGAPNYDNGQTDEGQARVYLGGPGCVTPPVVTLNFADPDVCLNDGLITLTDGTPAGGTYTGTGIVGTDQFNPSMAGVGTHSITYTYIAPSGCSANASNILTVNSNPVANVALGSASLNLCVNSPVVLVANNTSGLTYQWFKNNIPIAGAHYLSYLAYTTGNYQVQTTNVSGCTKMSKKKKVTHSGCRVEGEITESEFLIYPNPNHGTFSIEFSSDALNDGEATVQIFDMEGRLVETTTFNAADNTVEGNISAPLPSGIYLIKLIQGPLLKTERLVVE